MYVSQTADHFTLVKLVCYLFFLRNKYLKNLTFVSQETVYVSLALNQQEANVNANHLCSYSFAIVPFLTLFLYGNISFILPWK